MSDLEPVPDFAADYPERAASIVHTRLPFYCANCRRKRPTKYLTPNFGPFCEECSKEIETLVQHDPPVQIVDGIIRPVPWPGESPLLQCVDCKNTESPAGAMARQFNHGRCVHCGGWFKVVRA